MMERKRKMYIDIEGEQVFTAGYTFEMVQQTHCRIDRTQTVAFIAAIAATLSLIGSLILLIIR